MISTTVDRDEKYRQQEIRYDRKRGMEYVLSTGMLQKLTDTENDNLSQDLISIAILSSNTDITYNKNEKLSENRKMNLHMS